MYRFALGLGVPMLQTYVIIHWLKTSVDLIDITLWIIVTLN